MDRGKRPIEGGRPPVQGGRPPVQGGRPPVQGGRPPVEGGTPPVEGGRPPVEVGGPPVEGGRPPVERGRPPLEGGRQTRGRQRIPMRLIQNQEDLYATFSKRRLGIYKKASELCTLCGVDIGVIIFSPTQNPFSFFHPTMESVVHRCTNPGQPLADYERIVDAHTRSRITELNQRLDRILDAQQGASEREKQLDARLKDRAPGWWEQPVETLTKQQVEVWIEWFEEFKRRIEQRMEEMRNGASGSSQPNENVFDMPPPTVSQAMPDEARASGSSLPPDQNVQQTGDAPAFTREDTFFGRDFFGSDFAFPSAFGPDLSDDLYLPSQTNDPFFGSGMDPNVPYPYYTPQQEQDPFLFGSGSLDPNQFYLPSQGFNLPGTGGSGELGGAPDFDPFNFGLQQGPNVAGASGSGEAAGGSNLPDQYNVPPQAPNLPGTGGAGVGAGGSHLPGQYYGPPPPQAPNLSGTGGAGEAAGGSHPPGGQYYITPQAPNLSAGAAAGGSHLPAVQYYIPLQAPTLPGSHLPPGQYYILPQAPNLSGTGGAGGGASGSQNPGQYYYVRPPPAPRPTTGRKQDKAGTSKQKDKMP